MVSGNDLKKGRVSENNFDSIIEVGRYFDEPIKLIVKKVYKNLKKYNF